MNNIKNLSLFGICLAFVVIALGAWTRLVDAGLGCPDWPGCYGFVVFPTNEAEIALAEARYPTFPYDINKAIPEVVHRYFAAALGFLAIIMVYYSFKQNENKNIIKANKETLLIAGKILGILEKNPSQWLQDQEKNSGDKELIESLMAERNAARKKGDFKKADIIRDKLLDLGVKLNDTKYSIN